MPSELSLSFAYMERITGLILLLCLISLSSANTSPVIELKTYDVCEDTPIGAVAFTIKASDPENDPLTYSISGSNAIYFNVNKQTGNVTVARELNRELGDVMSLDVEVSDGPNTTPGKFIILLGDANDNQPIFKKASYDVTIPENEPVGTSLFKVEATDDDTSLAGVVHYSIDNVIPNEGFNLFSIVNTTGVVKLNGHLNYTALSTFYQLKIKATDGGGRCYYPETKVLSSSVYSVVTVQDVSDMDPQFIGLPYVGRVEENSDVGQTVFKVVAIDPDLGVNNKIIYSIKDSTADGLFTISSDDGVISVFSNIDREVTGDTVTLTVKAKESNESVNSMEASTTAEVQINIIDVNDNKPEFYKCEDPEDKLSCVKESQFTGEVFEHSLGSIHINMTVRDQDNNARTGLSLEGPDKSWFSVEPKVIVSESTVQLMVKQPQELDYEKKQQTILQVIAIDQEDSSFHSTATVTINIKDTNDNSPTFLHDTYKLTVAENSPAGTVVATITAEDPDTMDQNITYTLLPENIRLYFDVEPHTGEIYVKNGTLLDREVRYLYAATLQARDTDGKPGTTVLEITLTDINDNKPVFNRESYLVFVKEGQEVEVTIQATDADDPAELNSHIVYGIPHPQKYSDNFTIDPTTGVLRNNGELDREALDPELDGKIELNVTATDKGNPPLFSVVTVIINLQDVNDNAPEFSAPYYKFSVEEATKGAYVGSVHAEDLDQTLDFNRITFSFGNGNSGSFMIRTFAEERGYRGNITLDPEVELDYESGRTQFKLQIVAADLEQKKAEVTVTVDVLDLNDERPEFKPTESVTVKENTTITEAVGRFVGQDKDGNNSLVYELESIKCRCNGSWTDCNLFILDPTGEVRVNPDITVDYEQCDQAQIEAQVVDEYTEKGHNNSAIPGSMMIYIEDINDNAPEFLPTDSVFVVVAEGASKGTAVAKVNATDRDSGIHSQIDFKVSAVKFVDTTNHTNNMRMLFEVVTTQQKDTYVGIIQTSEKLELSLKGKYLVTVTATDTGGLSSSTVLEIFTVDESYKVELQFERPVEEIEQQREKITWALTAATKAAVEVVSISSDTAKASRNSDVTIMVAYFVFSNGTALTPNEVEKMLSDPEHYLALTNLGLMYIGKGLVKEEEIDTVKYILLGMVGGLLIVLVVLTTSLLCTRRNYRRKLKAAKAMTSTSMVNSGNQKSGPVVPGTNKYTMEGANPVLNLNIDATMVLDLDEENSDVDKVSLNSLDYSDDMNFPEKDTNPIMHVIQEEEEEDGPPEYIEPLGAALAQRGQKKEKPRVGFNNPAFSTTDL